MRKFVQIFLALGAYFCDVKIVIFFGTNYLFKTYEIVQIKVTQLTWAIISSYSIQTSSKNPPNNEATSLAIQESRSSQRAITKCKLWVIFMKVQL